MSRAVILAVTLALAPEACEKLMGKKPPPVEADPTPPPPPPPSATAPPIWSPPEVGTAPTASGGVPLPAVSPELAKARVAADAKDFKKVKTLLEKKVRGGKCTPEEAQLVYRACVATKDKPCADAVKAKHPEDVTD